MDTKDAIQKTNSRLQHNTVELMTTLPQSSALELLRQAGATEWEVVLYQMAQDKRHDLDPGILPYWRAKLKNRSDAAICEALMQGRWEFFPSVDQVLDLLESKAWQSYNDREAERTDDLLRESREMRQYIETHPKEREAIDAIVKETVQRVKSIPAPTARLKLVEPTKPFPRVGLVLTPEQIKARLAKEREEIERGKRGTDAYLKCRAKNKTDCAGV
jgi:hypothetical protein